MGSALVRTLAGVPSGAIRFSDLRGKSYRASITYTVTGSRGNFSLNVTNTAADGLLTVSGTYIAGKTDVTIIVNSNVYIYSDIDGGVAFTLSGGAAGDTVTLRNNGFIMGCGGRGLGSATGGSAITPATVGSTALKLGFTTAIIKGAGSFIGGGGGGGGGGLFIAGGGGGAGGGPGGNGGTSVGPVFSSGGSGGGLGGNGSNGATNASGTNTSAGGGGGGRKFPGTASGTVSVGGQNTRSGGIGGSAGGGGGINSGTGANVQAGGGGGGWGATGGSGRSWINPGVAYPATSGNGGGAGDPGTNSTITGGTSSPPNPTPGVAGGKAIDFNGFTSSTISGSGTTYGGTS